MLVPSEMTIAQARRSRVVMFVPVKSSGNYGMRGWNLIVQEG